MKPLSIRNRLLAGMLVLLVVALIPPFYFFDSSLREDIIHEAENRALKGLDTVGWIFHEHVQFTDSSRFNEWVTRLGLRMGVRITYIVNGTVLADSSISYDQLNHLDPHNERPEVLTAMQGKVGLGVRYSTTIGKELIYAAQKITGVKGIPDGVLRVALPVSIPSERLSRLFSGMYWVFLFTVMGTVLIGYLGTRPLIHSIEAFVRAAQAIGQGQYGRRIRVYPGKEFEPLVIAINTMAHNIEQHLTTLMDQKGRLEALFNGMHEGVMVLDPRGRIHSCNPALATFFPGIENRLGVTPMEATMKPELQSLVDKQQNGFHSTERITQLELSDDLFLEVNLVPFTTPDGIRRMVLVFHNISEREKLERVRRDFVANVSHELKTPLTSIKGFAEALIEMPPSNPEQMRSFLQTIQKNADHMTKMVNSLLVLARSQHKGENVALVAVDVKASVRQSIHDVSLAAAEKNITIENSTEKKPILVQGDRDGLLEIFRNLLDNAIKYSPEHTAIGVSMHETQETVTLCIKDSGPGIPKKARDRIFERFYRVERDTDTPTKDGSAGLGLAICRRIVRSLGGSIWVESPIDPETGRGATFFVTLNRYTE